MTSSSLKNARTFKLVLRNIKAVLNGMRVSIYNYQFSDDVLHHVKSTL